MGGSRVVRPRRSGGWAGGRAVVLLLLGAGGVEAQTGLPERRSPVAIEVGVTTERFQELHWILGRWRGTGGGRLASVPPFFEEYTLVDDSTIVMRSSGADSTFAAAEATARIELRGGIVRYAEGTGSGTPAIGLTADTVRLGPDGGVVFFRVEDGHWRADFAGRSPGGEPSYYDMHRVTSGMEPHPAPVQPMRMRMGGGSLITLPGGRLVVLATEAGTVVVQSVVDQAEGAGVSGVAVELATGDLIVEIDGARVRTAEELVEAYDAVPEGRDVEVVVERNATRRTLRFPRPPHAPSGRTLVVTDGGGGAGAWTTMGPGGGSDEVVIGGAHIRNNEQGMPAVTFLGSQGSASLVPLRVGDVIVAVDGRGIAALAGLELFYDPIPPGEEVTLLVIRNGLEETLTFPKPAGR